MTSWIEVVEAVNIALSGDTVEGRARLLECWQSSTPAEHAQRSVLAHYLADLQADLSDEITWDEAALREYAFVDEHELTAIGISSAAALEPSLRLNLGDGYLRAGRLAESRAQFVAGMAASPLLTHDEYGALIRGGLERLGERLAVAQGFPQSGGPRGPAQPI